MSTLESVAFKASLHKTNIILRVVGLHIDDDENNHTMMQKIWNRKLFSFFSFILYCAILGEVAWFIQKGINFTELSYTVPCVMLCVLGSAKSYYRIKYGHHINDLIHSLHRLQALQFDSGIHKHPTAYGDIQIMIDKLEQGFKIVSSFNAFALVAFMVGPLTIMAFIYHETGEVKYKYPFMILYPFNSDNPWVYPFVYSHQAIGGIIALFSVLGPDCLYYVFCTFIQIQFRSLQYDFERIITPTASSRLQQVNETYRKKFKACVSHHMELIRLMGQPQKTENDIAAVIKLLPENSTENRCCNLIEMTYSKTAMFNFMSSSLLLCLAGFNILAHEDMVMFSNFISFLFMCLMQIYLICDYGDKVSQASMNISNALYNSQWYMVDAKTAKDILMILTRAQKPCKLTAGSYTQVNLGAFTQILSTSWSYFALLQSVYSRRQ